MTWCNRRCCNVSFFFLILYFTEHLFFGIYLNLVLQIGMKSKQMKLQKPVLFPVQSQSQTNETSNNITRDFFY